jgi:serine/threonine protein kinase
LLELPELSFLSFAGNPCATTSDENPILDDIAWEELEVQQLLGEGASGIISKGAWKRQSDEKTVAIKLFKGAVTSDGSPADEMNACITAGKHPNLIDPIGKIHGHPDKKGLVLELIPPVYVNLGLPPTLDSCTRDSFHPDMVFTVETCKNILLGIASAAEHLHEREIKHGDLYAHNILLQKSTGHALLGDFGAATIYGKDHEHAEMLERMEVFAFGHLVEDLLGLVERKVDDEGFSESEKDAMAIEALNSLHWKCSNPVVMDRPSFLEVREELEVF